MTVSSSEVHATPNVRESAWAAAAVLVPGPRSRGSSETVSPTVTTLPSNACRNVCAEIDCVARADPVTHTRLAPYTGTGETTIEASSLIPAFERVTSSSSAVPVGVPGGAIPATAAVRREPTRAMPSHSRKPNAVSTSGCSRTTPRRVSAAELFSRAVRANSGIVTGPRAVADADVPRTYAAGRARDGSRGARLDVRPACDPTIQVGRQPNVVTGSQTVYAPGTSRRGPSGGRADT